jgi:hypothetical protein
VVAVIVPPDRGRNPAGPAGIRKKAAGGLATALAPAARAAAKTPDGAARTAATDRFRSAAGRPGRDRPLIYLDSSALIKLVLPNTSRLHGGYLVRSDGQLASAVDAGVSCELSGAVFENRDASRPGNRSRGGLLRVRSDSNDSELTIAWTVDPPNTPR